MSLKGSLLWLLGISAYQPAVNDAMPSLDDPAVQERREALGGHLALPSYTRLRWYLADLEQAQLAADSGELQLAGQLWRACKRDGVFRGVLSTRTSGLVRLPRKFRGRADIVQILKSGTGDEQRGAKRAKRKTKKERAQLTGPRSVFDEMCPGAELAALAADGIGLGVGVGELVPVQGRDYPVLMRLDPQWLVYRWYENRWYYRSTVGLVPIVPGDGRWVLHIPGGRIAPWQNGIWDAIGYAYIDKSHARLYKSNWEGKLANPARVAVSPQGASSDQEQSWFKAVMAWGVNTVFGMKQGYDVKLLESNGRGYESFIKTIEAAEREYIIATTGQTITVDGGSGFQNNDVHKAIRSDLIQTDGDALAYTLNTQVLPQWVLKKFGNDALYECPQVEYDTTPPSEMLSTANAHVAAANAAKLWDDFLFTHGERRLDVAEYAQKFSVPIDGDLDGDGDPDEETELPDIEDTPDVEDLDDPAANDDAEDIAA